MTDNVIPGLNSALAGRYRIEHELGQGGMATVYLAVDLKHDRRVALKVLAPDLAAVIGSERFLAEIRTTASLQHPHILALYDSGEAASFLYYVMPYVTGESLRDRLDRERQLPIDDALKIAADVADALDYAHRQGVVHRDIKPGNILLQDGKAVVSDFGIALAVGVAGGRRLTRTGMSLGTPQYMSPEQATGDTSVGAATDIYALGCVLYEMLAGEPPFGGNSSQVILGRIIAGEFAPVTTLRSSVPKHVDAAVTKSLQRIPADRFVSASRFAEALRDPTFRDASRLATPSPRPRPMRWVWPAVTVLALGFAVLSSLRPDTPDPVVWTQITLPEGRRVSIETGGHPLAISPDGRRIVFVAESVSGKTLFVRDLDAREPVLLEGTMGGRQPFFSPDGEWVGFFAGGQLLRTSLAGGAPIAITNVPSAPPYGASWGQDDDIVFSAGAGFYRVPSAGGDAEPFTPVLEAAGRRGADSTANPAGTPRWPHHLPDGTHALVGVGGGTALVDLRTGNARILHDGVQASYVEPGWLVFNAGEERLRAVRFDLDALEVIGAEVPVVDGVFRGPAGGAAAFAVSPSGTLVYLAGGFERTLWFADRNGREERVPVSPRGYRWPRLSPDGLRLAVAVDPRPSDLWVVDLGRGAAEPLTTEGHHVNPAWAPDSERLVFSLNEDLHQLTLGSDSPPTRIASRPLAQYQPSWSRDGVIMISEQNPETGWDLIAIDVADGSSRPYIATPSNEVVPSFSPDGHWVAYASDVSGRMQVYVSPFPGPGPRHAISLNGGIEPKWSASGREIFYRNGDEILVAEVDPSTGTWTAIPRVVLDVATYDFSQDNNWDVGPDGRFVLVKSDPSMLRQLELVQNFPQTIERANR